MFTLCSLVFLLFTIIEVSRVSSSSSQSEPPASDSLSSITMQCTVVTKSEECSHLSPGSNPYVECCTDQCKGRRMYTKRRVYTPMTLHSWWKNYTTDCLCCWDGGSSRNFIDTVSYCLCSILLVISLINYNRPAS